MTPAGWNRTDTECSAVPVAHRSYAEGESVRGPSSRRETSTVYFSAGVNPRSPVRRPTVGSQQDRACDEANIRATRLHHQLRLMRTAESRRSHRAWPRLACFHRVDQGVLGGAGTEHIRCLLEKAAIACVGHGALRQSRRWDRSPLCRIRKLRGRRYSRRLTLFRYSPETIDSPSGCGRNPSLR